MEENMSVGEAILLAPTTSAKAFRPSKPPSFTLKELTTIVGCTSIGVIPVPDTDIVFVVDEEGAINGSEKNAAAHQIWRDLRKKRWSSETFWGNVLVCKTWLVPSSALPIREINHKRQAEDEAEFLRTVGMKATGEKEKDQTVEEMRAEAQDELNDLMAPVPEAEQDEATTEQDDDATSDDEFQRVSDATHGLASMIRVHMVLHAAEKALSKKKPTRLLTESA